MSLTCAQRVAGTKEYFAAPVNTKQKWAVIAALATAVILAVLTTVSAYTNFTNPGVAQFGMSALGTKLFLAGTLATTIIAGALFLYRRGHVSADRGRDGLHDEDEDAGVHGVAGADVARAGAGDGAANPHPTATTSNAHAR